MADGVIIPGAIDQVREARIGLQMSFDCSEKRHHQRPDAYAERRLSPFVLVGMGVTECGSKGGGQEDPSGPRNAVCEDVEGVQVKLEPGAKKRERGRRVQHTRRE